nr:alpha/beta hydrolase [Bacillus sp. HMF5848]
MATIPQSITIRGVKVYYELTPWKDKPVIVLIHGFLSSSFSYRRLIPLLKESYTVLAVDLPPFGKSAKVKNFVYSYANMAQIVIELLQRLQLTQVTLVGHSMGGQIALNIAKQKPDIVKKLILLCSSGYLSKASKPMIYFSYLPFFSLVIKAWLYSKGTHGNLQNSVFDHSLIDEEMLRGYEEPFHDESIYHALTKMLRHREGDLPAEDLRTIRTPSLLIWGENDKVVPIEIGERLHKDLPSSHFVSFTQTGHLVPEERPLPVYEHMLEFI